MSWNSDNLLALCDDAVECRTASLANLGLESGPALTARRYQLGSTWRALSGPVPLVFVLRASWLSPSSFPPLRLATGHRYLRRNGTALLQVQPSARQSLLPASYAPLHATALPSRRQTMPMLSSLSLLLAACGGAASRLARGRGGPQIARPCIRARDTSAHRFVAPDVAAVGRTPAATAGLRAVCNDEFVFGFTADVVAAFSAAAATGALCVVCSVWTCPRCFRTQTARGHGRIFRAQRRGGKCCSEPPEVPETISWRIWR